MGGMVGPTEKNLTPEEMKELESVVRGEGPFEEGDPKEIKKLVEQAEEVAQKHDEGPFEANNQRLAELEAEVGAVAQRALISEAKDPAPQLVYNDPLESGVVFIETNNGDGTYVVTRVDWDGTAWQQVGPTHPMYRVAVRESTAQLNGNVADYVLFREMLKQDGSTEIVLDLSLPVVFGKVTSITNLSSGGTVLADVCNSAGDSVDTNQGYSVQVSQPPAAPDKWLGYNIAVDDVITFAIIGWGADLGVIIGPPLEHTGPDTGTTYNPINFGGAGNHIGDFCYPVVDGRGHVVQYIMLSGTTTTAYTYSGGSP